MEKTKGSIEGRYRTNTVDEGLTKESVDEKSEI